MIIDCDAIGKYKINKLTKHVETNKLEGTACTIVQVGSDNIDNDELTLKINMCTDIGISCKLLKLPADISETALLAKIDTLNEANIPYMILSPLPEHINKSNILNHINQNLDINLDNVLSKGAVLDGTSVIKYLNVQAIFDIIESQLHCSIDYIKGAIATIVSDDVIFSKQISTELIQHGLTVNVCNLMTDEDLMATLIGDCDIFISALNKNKNEFFNEEFFKKHYISLNSLYGTLAIDVCGNISKGLTNCWEQTINGISTLTKCAFINNVITLFENNMKNNIDSK